MVVCVTGKTADVTTLYISNENENKLRTFWGGEVQKLKIKAAVIYIYFKNSLLKE